MPDDQIEKLVGGYALEECIGRGGMALVYRAYQPAMRRYVALKVIDLGRTVDQHEEVARRFAQEAAISAALEHLHILPIYDYGLLDGDTAFLAMRLLRGGSLADRLVRGPLPYEVTLDIFNQVAAGLAYAHSQGIVHRDIKPSNILFDNHGNAYLTDFGLAKLMSGGESLTPSGFVVGTPAYVAPEILADEVIDQRADVYSLGVVLYHMLVGQPPFQPTEGGILSMMYRQVHDDPPPLRSINPSIPPEIDTAVMRALGKQAEERYGTIEEMARAVNAAFTAYGTPLVVRTGWRSRRGWGLAAAILCIAVGLVIISLWLGMRGSSAGTDPAEGPPHIANLPPDSRPSSDEVAAARTALGGDGFIAYIACALDSEFQSGRVRELSDAAEYYEVGFRAFDSQNDPYEQLTQIERARLEGARALIICPLSNAAIDETLRAAERAGMPIVFTAPVADNYGGVMIDANNFALGYQAGEMAGQLINERLAGEADVVLLAYDQVRASVDRADGMTAGLAASAPDAHLLGRYPSDGGRQTAYNTIKGLLEEGVEFDVVIANADAPALGAIQALEEAGIAPDAVIVTGVNGEALALSYIEAGYFFGGTIALDRTTLSNMALGAAVRLLGGAEPPENLLGPPGRVITRQTLQNDATPTPATS